MEILLLLACIVIVVLLYRQRDRLVQEWIDAGLLSRKPRVFTRYRRYK